MDKWLNYAIISLSHPDDKKQFITLAGILFLMLAHVAVAAPAEGITVGTFNHNELTQWDERSFKGRTNYQIIDQNTLQASCQNTASALYRQMTVDLTRTPLLRWSWRVDHVHPELNDTTKAGDDYAARIYVVVAPNALLPWRVRAINYVWANRQSVGSLWPNAFTDQAIMVALRSGQPTTQGQFTNEVRNVREDFKNLFGLDVTNIDGVAIMTDCDNSGLPSTGYYRDIRFTSE